MKTNFRFDKILYDFLSNTKVCKYVNRDTGEIIVTAESAGTGEILGQKLFSSIRTYSEWLDSVIYEHDGYRGVARELLDSLLEQKEEEEDNASDRD